MPTKRLWASNTINYKCSTDSSFLRSIVVEVHPLEVPKTNVRWQRSDPPVSLQTVSLELRSQNKQRNQDLCKSSWPWDWTSNPLDLQYSVNDPIDSDRISGVPSERKYWFARGKKLLKLMLFPIMSFYNNAEIVLVVSTDDVLSWYFSSELPSLKSWGCMWTLL